MIEKAAGRYLVSEVTNIPVDFGWCRGQEVLVSEAEY
jgi:hypothetical protein